MIYPTLYKLSTTGKVSTWYIETEGNKFRTVSGFFDGLKVTSDWTVCEGKSYNNSEQQATKQAEALHKKKKDLGAFENIKDIDKPTIFTPMTAKGWDKEKKKAKYPIASQPKLDGIRCVIKSNGMWSRTGKPIITAPHIWHSIKEIFEIHPDLVLDGELYCDKLANDFNKIVSCVKKTKPTLEDLKESEKYIEFFCYDYDNVEKYEFIHRCANLELIYNLEKQKYVQLVPTVILNNTKEVEQQFEEYIKLGYEGQMLRILDSEYENKRSKYLLKDKEFITEEFKITSVNEGIGKLAGKVGTITVITDDEVYVDCAVNGTHEYLEDLWKRKEELVNLEATVRYFGKTPDKSLRFPKIIDIDRFSYE